MYCCVNLASENERLSRKVCRLKEKLEHAKDRLYELQSNAPSGTTDECKTGSKESSNNSELTEAGKSRVEELEEKFEASKSRLLAMHNKTTRLYHSEMQQKQEFKDQVQQLRTENDLLQIKSNQDRQKILTLERRVAELEKLELERNAETSKKLKELTTKSDKLYTENILLRRELSAFDPEFFEELEDLKYSLKKSQDLNVEYEKSLDRLCRHYKLPFVKPCVEKDS